MKIRVHVWRSKFTGDLEAACDAADTDFICDMPDEMTEHGIRQRDALMGELERAALDYANTTLFTEEIPTTLYVELSASVIKE